jgi:hypothetical protein
MGKTFKDSPEEKKKRSKVSKKSKLHDILDEEYLEEIKKVKR